MLQKNRCKLFFRILPFTVVLFLLLRRPEGGCCAAAGDDGGGGASTSAAAAVSSAHTIMMRTSYSGGNHEEDGVAQVCRESARNPRCINRSNLLQVFGWEIAFNLLLRQFFFYLDYFL
jgi:hypothetical protein